MSDEGTLGVETEVLHHLARQWQLNLKGWRGYQSNFTHPVCTWFGIVCNEDTKSVIKIELPRVQLSGTISAELGILSNLQQIDLSENELFGTIPGDFRELDKLEKLNLGYNHLEGPLEEFHPFLLELNVTHNDLNGPIAEDFGFNGGNLKVIDASYNRIGGVIPRSIGNFVGLTFLDFGSNELYGPIPSTIGRLNALKGLFLNDNRLMGTIPTSLTRENMELVQIFFEHNDLSGTIPAAMANLKNIQDFYIDGNKFTGSVPDSLCALGLNQNFRTDATAEGMNGCNAIACPVNTQSKEGIFPCKSCGSQGFSPYLGHSQCYHMNEKKILEIFYDQTNGPMWKDSSGWGVDNVGVCNYRGVQCNGAGHVIVLDLSNTGLSGTIPEELGMLRNLEVLDLSHNNLVGFLPSDLRLPPLGILDVANNKLEGFIPPMLCQKGDINGNGFNGDFNCDNIACPPGTWSSIGRATPRGRELDEGEEIHECKPCHKHERGFIGSLECSRVHVIGDDGEGISGLREIVTPDGNLLLGLVVLCGVIGVLATIVLFRARKVTRQIEPALRYQDAERGGGSDTDSYYTEATDAQSVHLTKLDDFSVQTEDDEASRTGPLDGGLDGFEAQSGLDGLEPPNDDVSLEGGISVNEETLDVAQISTSSGTAAAPPTSEFSTRQKSELWLDVPSMDQTPSKPERR